MKLEASAANDDDGMRVTRIRAASEELADNPRYAVYEFRSAILPSVRDVMVYLPPQYFSESESDAQRRFPVLYLHDGQNLFDGLTSYVPGRTWRADTTADELAIANMMEPVILVGIANTGLRRMAEYTPTRDFKMGGGEGQSYGRLLIEELKPFIDGAYRTKTGPGDTGLGGSSLGGLISLSLGLEHPEVFGKLAIMSPSLWWGHRSILQFVHGVNPRPDLKIWLDMGTAEGARHLRDADILYKMLVRLGWGPEKDLRYVTAEGAVHDENAWADRLGEALKFLFPVKSGV
ncbi:MAG: alpha/beta hydrolase [Acidobacteriaceae bacterium]|nr:alpha/beta hydrolase [Acidobacteriaceae bacterium]